MYFTHCPISYTDAGVQLAMRVPIPSLRDLSFLYQEPLCIGIDPISVYPPVYQAKNILIAVGGKPQKLSIPGAEHCITSDEALELEECPKKVVVLGGGYIALEFAGIFKRFGSDVHVVYRADLPLRGFDEEVRGV